MIGHRQNALGFQVWARWALLAVCVLLAACGTAQATPPSVVESDLSPAIADRDGEAPTLRILEPADGATVSSPVRFVAELENYEFAPKGRVRDGEGHLHVLVNKQCIDQSEVIPSDDDHVHVGTGANLVEVELEPGEHHLCVQIGDGFHSAVNLTAELTIHVE